MATYYLVATGNINAAASFSSTSGGAPGAVAPTTGDTIICDANSGAANLTINVAISLARFDCQGGTGLFTGTVTHNAFTLTITGSGVGAFRLSPGMNYVTPATTSLVAFTLTSGIAQLTGAGQTFAAITMNGAGGTVQQQDNLLVNAVANAIWTLTAGTWDCNGKNTTVCTASLSNANVRALIMGGVFTVGGNVGTNQTPWNCGTTTNFTLTPNAGSFAVLGPLAAVVGWSFAFGTISYPSWTFNARSVAGSVVVTGTPTFAALTIGSGWAFIFSTVGTIIVTSAFTWTGTAGAPIMLIASQVNAGTAINCPSGSCSLQWGVIMNVTGGGGAAFNATDVLALGAPGWVVTPPLDAVSLPPAVATALWQDLLTSSDFTTAGSVGALVAAIVNLQFTVQAIGRGTVAAGGTTTSIPTSAFAPSGAAANQFAGRAILFDAATTTVALRGQVGVISASTNAANPTLTVGALTTAPAAGDTFSVV